MKKNVTITGIITAVFCVLIYICYDVTYCLNDDVMIQSILSGSYSGSPSYMTYYLSVPLGMVLSLLYKIAPVIPWLGMFFTCCYILCIFLVLNRLIGVHPIKTGKMFLLICGMLSFFALFLENMVMIHYTVVAATVGATGIFLLATCVRKSDWKSAYKANIISVLLLVLCYLIRANVFFMLLPFVLIAFAYKIFYEGIKAIKYYVPLIVTFAGLFLLMFVINTVPYCSGEYKEYVKYNDARTRLYDYVGISETDEAKKYYSFNGIDDTTYSLYKSYNIMLANNSSAEKLDTFSNYENVKNESTLSRLKNAVSRYFEIASDKKESRSLKILIYGVYVVVIILMISMKKYKDIIFVGLLFVLRSLLFVYLIYKGRYPERVTESIMIIEMAVLAGFLVRLARRIKSFNLSMPMPMIMMLILLYSGYVSVGDMNNDYKVQSTINDTDDVLYSYMAENQDKNYFLDVYATVYRTKKATKNYENKDENYLLLGGWMSGHPLTKQKLEGIGYRSAREALTTGDNTYIVLRKDVGATKEDFENWLGIRLELEDVIVESTNEFQIYKRAE